MLYGGIGVDLVNGGLGYDECEGEKKIACEK